MESKGKVHYCKLNIANTVLEHTEVKNVLSKVDKSVILALPSNIIPENAKAVVFNTPDPAAAAFTMMSELQKSEDPEKLVKFTERLRDIGQTIIADIIMKYNAETTCSVCYSRS